MHPTAQSHGIGSHLINILLLQAGAQGKPIYVGALKESASNRFYQRHGFTPTHIDEWDIYYVRLPSPRSA